MGGEPGDTKSQIYFRSSHTGDVNSVPRRSSGITVGRGSLLPRDSQETKIKSTGQGSALLGQQWPGSCGFQPPAFETDAKGYVGGVGIVFHRKLGLRLAVNTEQRASIL